jgi:type IV secretion system protein VirB8
MVDKNNSDEIKQFLKESNFWETDKVASLNRSNKVAWGLALFGLGLATVATWSVGQLTPLKTVEPYVIRVNDVSGRVDIVTALKEGKETYTTSLNKYFIAKYIKHREGYSRQLAEQFYYVTGLMSDETEQKNYYAWFKPKNPLSPLNLYSDNEKVKIDVLSISAIDEDKNIYLARYRKIIETASSAKDEVSHWAATLRFKYTTAPTKESDREINPLGFQVVEYRNDPDSIEQSTNPTITYRDEDQTITTTTKNGGLAPQSRTR